MCKYGEYGGVFEKKEGRRKGEGKEDEGVFSKSKKTQRSPDSQRDAGGGVIRRERGEEKEGKRRRR